MPPSTNPAVGDKTFHAKPPPGFTIDINQYTGIHALHLGSALKYAVALANLVP